MKLQCKQDYITRTKGIINKVEYQEKIDGLTEGKIYTVLLITDVNGNLTNGYGSIETGFLFLVYNDNQKWDTYKCDLFSPLEDK